VDISLERDVSFSYGRTFLKKLTAPKNATAQHDYSFEQIFESSPPPPTRQRSSDKKFAVCTFLQKLIKAMLYILNPLSYSIKRRIQYLLQTEMTGKEWQ
jgi:hypothetical protein